MSKESGKGRRPENRALVAILAAGRARRFGSPKQLARFGGESLVRRAAKCALESEAAQACVVLGAHADAVAREVADLPVRVLINEAWDVGQATSVAIAAKAARDSGCSHVAYLPVDMVFVDASHMRALLDAAYACGGPAVSTFDAHAMAPCVFPSECFDQLRCLVGDKGAVGMARDMLAKGVAAAVPFADARMAFDVDAPDDLLAAERMRNAEEGLSGYDIF